MSVNDYKSENILNLIIVILLLFILSACGGSTTVGNPGESATRVDLTGTAQKGPFTEGSTIAVYELNKAFNQTGTSFSTEIINNLGDYSVPVEVQSTFVELFVQGFYFDEISGDLSSAQLTLNALADLSGNDSINVNILTTLSSPRIRWLIKQGATFSNARAQAENEILTAFGIKTDSIRLFEDMTTLRAGEDNAALLAISAIVMQLAHWEDNGAQIPATLSWVISKIKHDVETDGVLDNEVLRTRIQYAKSWVNLSQVRDNMETRYQAIDPSIVIPRFEDYFSPMTMTLLSTHHVGQRSWQSLSWEDALLVVSPDETRVYLASGNSDISDTLIILNTSTSTIEMEKTYDREIRSLVLNPSGSKLFVIWAVPGNTSSEDKVISIFDTTTFKEIDSVTEGEVGAEIREAIVVASSTIDDPDPDLAEMVYLLDLDKQVIRILNLRTDATHDLQNIEEAIEVLPRITDMTITQDNERLYLLADWWEEGTGSVLSIESDDPMYSYYGYLENRYKKIIVSPDGATLYFFYVDATGSEYDFKIVKHDANTMERINAVEFSGYYKGKENDDFYPLYASINDIAISPDGLYLYLISFLGIITIHTPTFSVHYPENYAFDSAPIFSWERGVIGPDGSKVYVLSCLGGNHELMIFDTGVHY